MVDFSGIGWGNAITGIGWGNAITLISSLATVAAAIVVARIVSGRDDRRQRQADRRAIQRETIIALQDGWLELDAMLTEALHRIQAVRSTVKRNRELDEIDWTALANSQEGKSSTITPEQRSERMSARYEELDALGEKQNAAVIEVRQMARRIKLLESRVSMPGIQATSRAMRECVEVMIMDVANYDGERYGQIRDEMYQPAYDRFIQAGYEVLADLNDWQDGLSSRDDSAWKALADQAAREREQIQLRIRRESGDQAAGQSGSSQSS